MTRLPKPKPPDELLGCSSGLLQSLIMDYGPMRLRRVRKAANSWPWGESHSKWPSRGGAIGTSDPNPLACLGIRGEGGAQYAIEQTKPGFVPHVSVLGLGSPELSLGFRQRHVPTICSSSSSFFRASMQIFQKGIRLLTAGSLMRCCDLAAGF